MKKSNEIQNRLPTIAFILILAGSLYFHQCFTGIILGEKANQRFGELIEEFGLNFADSLILVPPKSSWTELIRDDYICLTVTLLYLEPNNGRIRVQAENGLRFFVYTSAIDEGVKLKSKLRVTGFIDYIQDIPFFSGSKEQVLVALKVEILY